MWLKLHSEVRGGLYRKCERSGYIDGFIQEFVIGDKLGNALVYRVLHTCMQMRCTQFGLRLPMLSHLQA